MAIQAAADLYNHIPKSREDGTWKTPEGFYTGVEDKYHYLVYNIDKANIQQHRTAIFDKTFIIPEIGINLGFSIGKSFYPEPELDYAADPDFEGVMMEILQELKQDEELRILEAAISNPKTSAPKSEHSH